jgi:hypothetical protein
VGASGVNPLLEESPGGNDFGSEKHRGDEHA